MCPPVRSALNVFIAISLWCSVLSVWPAPFSKNFQFTQPDGTKLSLWGQGDEFHAVFETTTGYTVVFDPQQQAYFYADRVADGKSLVSTGVFAHKAVPAGLAQHIRIDPDAVASQAHARQMQWNNGIGLSKRWSRLKSLTLGKSSTPADSGPQPAPPQSPTLGAKLGLTLLIDFSDAPATVPQGEIDAFCNGDIYTGFGNNGSVKKYFSDVSARRLNYSNVVTVYVRMSQPKSYYNDTKKDCGTQGRLLINDALTILKARSDYSSTILPTFSNLTTDGSGLVLAFNVFFAGADSGVWSYGLWPHSWVLASPVTLGNGKSVYAYQMTDIGTALELGTFCHENGHMLCDFPDIYDYGYDSYGGAGVFCLMGYGGSGTNPKQVCAYLKLAAGWAAVTDLDSTLNLTGTLVAAPNAGHDQFFRYRRPGFSTEYFLFENRQKAGRDSELPAAGIAVWHVDELGDRDNQSLVPNSLHQNYEVTLVQADNFWHFENNVNAGDANDLYFLGNGAAGYANRLDDTSGPNAHWWDGSASGLNLNSFSAAGMTMSFAIGTGAGLSAPVLTAEAAVTTGTDNTIYWSALAVAPSGPPLVGPTGLSQAPTSVTFDPDGSPGDGVLVFSVDPAQRLPENDVQPPSLAEASSGWNWNGSLAIPDNTGTEVGINCSPPSGLPNGAYVTRVQVHHEISHPRISDLECRLYNTNHNWVLRNNTGSGANVNETLAQDTLFDGDSPVQSWYYRVLDNVSRRSGTLTNLQLLVYYDSPPGPDLRMSWASWASAAVTEGASFWVQGSVTNAGSASAGASHVQLYLSTDNDFDTSDDYFVGELSVGALAAGAAQAVQWDFNMPNLGSGNYAVWMVFVVDNRGEVAETYEDNTFKTTSGFTASDPVEYYAERATNATFASSASSGWIQPLQFTFSNLTPGQTYWYRVKARWDGQESGWSNVEFSQQEPLHISGAVNYYTGSQKVPGVDIALVGDNSQTVTTGSDGSYGADLTYGWSGTSTPGKNNEVDPRAGVNGLDLTLMRRHVLGIEKLNSPYKLIAADVTGSGTINGLDITYVMRLILALTNSFPAGSWKFVPADYVFSDPANPWALPFPTDREYSQVTADRTGQDFFGIKLGDVSGGWVSPMQPARLAGPSPGGPVTPGITVYVDEQTAIPEQTVELPIYVSGFERVTSIQFTLTWDPAVLQFQSVTNFGLNRLSPQNFNTGLSGKLPFVWDDMGAGGITLTNGARIFSVQFKAIGSKQSASTIGFDSSPTAQLVIVGLKETPTDWRGGMIIIRNGNQPRPACISSDVGGQFRIAFFGAPGITYTIQCSDSVDSSDWVTLATRTADAQGFYDYVDTPPVGATSRFYRSMGQP